jgi:hypothetical protein
MATLGGAPALASAQALTRTCLSGEARSQGLSVQVDGDGRVHLSRVDRITGDVLHTVIGPDGAATDVVVAAAASRLAADEITVTGLALIDDDPVICFRNPRVGGVFVAWRAGGGFVTRQVAAAADAGRDCGLVREGEGLRLFFTEAGRLRTATLAGPGAAAAGVLDLDAVAGRAVGRDLEALTDDTGAWAVVHHDGTGALRLTYPFDGGPRTEVIHGGAPAAGVRPTMVFGEDGRLFVAHGGLTARLDAESDAGLYETVGRPGGAFSTASVFGGAGGGGQAALRTADGRALFARERQRSALFGAYDALWYFVDTGAGLTARTPLEQATQAASRHDYGPLAATVDPFGEPVLVYGDARSATIVSPATAPTCLYRRPDADADALPDVVETRLGTDPQNPDSDGDGTPDGVEVLRLGTDPTADDTCTPSPERCDAIDNDCDGETDEDTQEACYPGPAGTSGVGRCTTGLRTCAAGAYGACQGAVVPEAADARCDGRDEDCDGRTDEDFTQSPTACGVGACAAVGRTACVFGSVEDTCEPGVPLPIDATCDGVDEDCNGRVDDAFVPSPTDCGQGACAAAGELVCVDGAPTDTCRPASPLGDDDGTCDGVDDDCDGQVDEDYRPVPTDCGAGSCTSNGVLVCEGGRLRDTCRAAEAGGDDATCDGIDDDCDGRTDEDAVPVPVTCGVGVCARAGLGRCEGGRPTVDCLPGAPPGVADGCNGLDDDCDGAVDEDAVPRPASCGLGVCRRSGEQRCVAGALETVCAPGTPPAPDDALCDGLDGDCDGRVDEDAVPRATTCGLGVCERDGVATCDGGSERIACSPGAPLAARDETCDGLDDDCDGESDEDYPGAAFACGIGVCRTEGRARCVAGRIEDACLPRPPAPEALDDDCNGLDDDCDGTIDEAYFPGPTRCGAGACAATGERLCAAGDAFDTCVPGLPAADDATCDGIDDDCDGAIDEDAAPVETRCGTGACASVGQRRCESGRLVDTCVAGAPAADDATCDGLDADCDGESDEDARPSETTCGIGACLAVGERRCEAGAWLDTCAPHPRQAATDRTCDGVDDDCDGQRDEDFRGALTTCGQGACEARGRLRCVGGVVVDDCSPGRPATPTDVVCDGRDEDCDGAVDEDAPVVPTTCGRGVCGATGETRCLDGRRVDTCVAGPASADDDTTCDGLDDDCDGVIDEDFIGRERACGAGACRRTAREICIAGRTTDVCVEGPPASADDETCDGQDDDCDGVADEDARPTPSRCGQGVCAADGVRACIGGRWQDDCEPAPPVGDDATCDGLDDDCDGSVDEAYLPTETHCGEGVCARSGARLCLAGGIVDTCRAATPDPETTDDDCDGLDDDCDGVPDDDFAGAIETCGTGACRAEGPVTCVAGRRRSTCRPAPPAAADDTCDGIDDDCDGAVDEDFAPAPVVCAPGACHPTGHTACLAGRMTDDCDAPPQVATDETCDGLDDDCDGVVDDEALATPLTCGLGACAAAGERRCEAGGWRERCVAGRPAADDATCDGVDDDCDGTTDEDAAPAPTRCGTGVCEATGTRTCADGRWVDDCQAGRPLGVNDVTCDGVDDDCDGVPDDDAAPVPSECGVGACAAVGHRRCVAGRSTDDCRPSASRAGNDATCDGVDDDCDGDLDEDAAGQEIVCGTGACQRSGWRGCEAGRFIDTCQPGTPLADGDRTCNGLDDDCDGRTDEDVAPTPVTCGIGLCARDGVRVCEGGQLVDRCVPGPAAANDATCDGRDDDCDGAVDEDVQVRGTTCGLGACASHGERRCEGGRLVDTCAPGTASGPDRECDGVDQDCDGRADDGFTGVPVLCGEGACGRIGETACEGGVVVEVCTPGAPAARDGTCDAVDDDCDGDLDEDAPRTPSVCGRGACEATGEALCVDGAWVDTCMPGAPRDLSDATCDGIDEDCDGLVDEDCVPDAPDVLEADGGDTPADAFADDAGSPAPDAAPETTTDGSAPPRDARAEPAGDMYPPASADGPLFADATPVTADLDPPHTARPDGVLGDVSPLPDAAFDPWPEAGVTIETTSPNPRVDCDCRAGGAGAVWPLSGLLALAFAGLPRRRRRAPAPTRDSTDNQPV